MTLPTGDVTLSPFWRERLSCRNCQARLALPDVAARRACSSCGAVYEVNGGVLGYGPPDTFYESHGFTSVGRAFNKGVIGKAGLYFARYHYLYDIQRATKAGAGMIELGSGGGSMHLARRYTMLGVDISAISAQRAAKTYGSALRASITELPLASGSADAIVSSCLLEHLDDAAAPAALNEMARVLRPGGTMVHFFDLDCTGPFTNWAKRQPWFKPIMVDSKGHAGLRTLKAWRGLFAETGFEIERARLMNKFWLQDLSIWAAFDQPGVSAAPRLAARTSSYLRRTTGVAADVGVMLIQDTFGWMLPASWAAKAIVTLRKRA